MKVNKLVYGSFAAILILLVLSCPNPLNPPAEPPPAADTPAADMPSPA
ncbi:MAG: hypothetical protein AB1798_11550 [Spirochaetota bacterium]